MKQVIFNVTWHLAQTLQSLMFKRLLWIFFYWIGKDKHIYHWKHYSSLTAKMAEICQLYHIYLSANAVQKCIENISEDLKKSIWTNYIVRKVYFIVK